jgi:RNA polymerase sigma factor (sigma-70 family)
MKGGTTAIKNIPFESPTTLRLPKQVQLKRIRNVIEGELTDSQREILLAYYFAQQTIPQIAKDRGVNKSTVCRTLHRAEDKLRKYLRY